MKSILISGLLVLTYLAFGQNDKKVLFIGNSYTSVNNLPQMTKDLASSMGDVLTVDSNTPGGTTFYGHTNNSTSLSKIGQSGWDYVVLQAQSQEPSFPPAQVASDTYPYASILVDSVLSANPCAIPLFYLTWGRESGDQLNCSAYPVICTYDGMQGRLRESYLEMASDNDAEVSPVGAAWKYVRDNYPSMNLYNSDGSHPNVKGSYLAACVHYASIFKKSPVGASYISTLSASDALILQTAAELIVIDSMETWNFGVRNVTAEFDYSVNDFDVQFNYSGNNGTNFDWVFGDGNMGSDSDPTNTYLSNGTYTVELSANDGCTFDNTSLDIVISVSTAGIEENETHLIESIIRRDDQITIGFDQFLNGTYTLFESSGKLISSQNFSGATICVNLPKENTIYLLTISKGSQSQTLKLTR